MFKKLTRSLATLVGSDIPKTVDVEFDRAKANWSIMQNVLLDVRKQIEEYRSSMAGICKSSSQAVEALALLFPQPSTATVTVMNGVGGTGGTVSTLPTAALTQHPYSLVAHTSKSRLHTLLHERFETCERRLTHSCLANCSELLDKFNGLKLRITEREEMLEELEHYTNKLAGLQRDHEKLLSQGKRETIRDEERRLRNEESTAKLRAQFVAMNRALTDELSGYWDRRLDLLTPIMLDFFTAQQKFASELTECSADIARTRDVTLKTAAPIDFSKVLYEVTSAASEPTARSRPRTYSNSVSTSHSSSTRPRQDSNSPTLQPMHSNTLPPPLPISLASSVSPPAPSSTSSTTLMTPPTPATTNSNTSATPIVSPQTSTTSTPSTSLSPPPAIPARPSKKPIINTATTPTASSVDGTNGSGEKFQTHISPPPLPSTLAHSPLGPPPLPTPSPTAPALPNGPPRLPPPVVVTSSPNPITPTSASAVSVDSNGTTAISTSSAAATAGLDASYDRALLSTGQPSFTSSDRRPGPPPLPPTTQDPEPWPKEIVRNFESMHQLAEREMNQLQMVVPPSPAARTNANPLTPE